MELVPEETTLYDITRDLVLPFLGIIATVVLGSVIANVLRQKDEKAKIKNLLIDHYMEHLKKARVFFRSGAVSFREPDSKGPSELYSRNHFQQNAQ